MKWSEVIVTSFLVFLTFALGFFVGVQWERHRGGGHVREVKTNNSRRTTLLKTTESIDVANPGITQRGCSPTAALSLLWKAESSSGQRMSGDGGLARGHLQFHEGTWNDGLLLLGLRDNLSWQWPLATNELWRCWVVAIANWQRYCPEALAEGNIKLLIRHHRLPTKPFRVDNDAYLTKVLKGNK